MTEMNSTGPESAVIALSDIETNERVIALLDLAIERASEGQCNSAARIAR